jgi:hypothetical protein
MPCPKEKSKKEKQNAAAPFAYCSGIYTLGNKGKEGSPSQNALLLLGMKESMNESGVCWCLFPS